MKILGIIPSRYHSVRFPAKPLADIGGISMIQRVYEQTLQTRSLDKIVIATDHEEIAEHAIDFGANVAMTSSNHSSGTDRCFEAYQQQSSSYDFVINIQGDEPFINPQQIDQLAENLTSEVQLATQIKKIENPELLSDPNIVKVICDNNQDAIYFSRAAIPFCRSKKNKNDWLEKYTYFKHIGLYAYRTDILKNITQLSPSLLEKTESLEQLRWLENGYKIKTIITEYESHSVDTLDDLKKVIKLHC